MLGVCRQGDASRIPGLFRFMSILTFLKKKWIRAKYGGVILRRYYGVKGEQIIGAVHAPAKAI